VSRYQKLLLGKEERQYPPAKSDNSPPVANTNPPILSSDDWLFQRTNFKNLKNMFNYQRDPRPDLTEDHERWIVVLQNAFHSLDGGKLWGMLHFLRCLGARLEETATGYKLLPGDIPQEEYQKFKVQHLKTVHQDLVNVLSSKDFIAKDEYFDNLPWDKVQTTLELG